MPLAIYSLLFEMRTLKPETMRQVLLVIAMVRGKFRRRSGQMRQLW